MHANKGVTPASAVSLNRSDGTIPTKIKHEPKRIVPTKIKHISPSLHINTLAAHRCLCRRLPCLDELASFVPLLLLVCFLLLRPVERFLVALVLTLFWMFRVLAADSITMFVCFLQPE